MSQQIIDISTPDDGLGDVLRTGFDKTNQNFTELYNGKVDKETGKGLSENNFTDTDKAKLDGIEAGAQVNVNADFSETDPSSDSFILNKPPSLYASVGHFHYNDLATHTTPLVVLPSVPKKLTNDTLGVGTEKDFAPYGVADVWDTTDNVFTFSPLDLGDQAQIRFDFLLSSTSPSQKFTLYVKFGVGSPSEYDMLVSSWVEKDVITYGQIIREISFSIDNEDWLYNQAEIYILSDDDASVKVNGWYVPIIRKSINVINIEGDFLSSIISTYTPVTTPLAGTELALIHDGTEFKKVAVSEFGGGIAKKIFQFSTDSFGIYNFPATSNYVRQGGFNGMSAYGSARSDSGVSTITALITAWGSGGGAIILGGIAPFDMVIKQNNSVLSANTNLVGGNLKLGIGYYNLNYSANTLSDITEVVERTYTPESNGNVDLVEDITSVITIPKGAFWVFSWAHTKTSAVSSIYIQTNLIFEEV